jgi:hypothetical protein
MKINLVEDIITLLDKVEVNPGTSQRNLDVAILLLETLKKINQNETEKI